MCLFFFQAEDGIRDLTVTGVQTCALPIYPAIDRVGHHVEDRARVSGAAREEGERDRRELRRAEGLRRREVGALRAGRRALRSEERRVGKEGGFLWWVGWS